MDTLLIYLGNITKIITFLNYIKMGYSRKNPNGEGGRRVEDVEFPGALKKEDVEFPGGVLQKNSHGISVGLGF